MRQKQVSSGRPGSFAKARERIAGALSTATALAHAGVAWPSIFLYPIRRRGRDAHIELRFRDGLTLTAESDTPVMEIYREVWVEQCYLPREFRVRCGGTIVDIGAHVGIFTLWAARQFPGSRIVAVEPAPAAFAHLQHNLAENGVAAAEVAQCACAARNQELVLYSRGLDWGHTIYPRGRDGRDFQPLLRVRGSTLEELFSRFRVRECELLKINCEGAEYELLSATPEGLLRSIRHLALEYHLDLADPDLARISDLLTAGGFRVRTRETHETGGYLYAWRE